LTNLLENSASGFLLHRRYARLDGWYFISLWISAASDLLLKTDSERSQHGTTYGESCRQQLSSARVWEKYAALCIYSSSVKWSSEISDTGEK
jgi:hypothetical protein